MINFMLCTCYRGELPQLNKYIYILKKKVNITSNAGKLNAF